MLHSYTVTVTSTDRGFTLGDTLGPNAFQTRSGGFQYAVRFYTLQAAQVWAGNASASASVVGCSISGILGKCDCSICDTLVF